MNRLFKTIVIDDEPAARRLMKSLLAEFSGSIEVIDEAGNGREAIEKIAGSRIASAIEKVRSGDIVIDPGYDGVFGVVKIWKEGEEKPILDASKEQLAMF